MINLLVNTNEFVWVYKNLKIILSTQWNNFSSLAYCSFSSNALSLTNKNPLQSPSTTITLQWSRMSDPSPSIKEVPIFTSQTSPPQSKLKPLPSSPSTPTPKSESSNKTSKTISSIENPSSKDSLKRKSKSLSNWVIKPSSSRVFSSVMTMDTFSEPPLESIFSITSNQSNYQSCLKVSSPYQRSTGKSTLKPVPPLTAKLLTEPVDSDGNLITPLLWVKTKRLLISEDGLLSITTAGKST